MKEMGVSPESLIVFMSELSFVILNRYPYVSGHVMVVPSRHTGDLAGLSPEEFSDMMAVMRLSTLVIDEAFKPQGLNIGMNLGKAAGAGIEDHLHIHIVPRWSGDTNFMPVIAETKVIPESLEETYARILEHFNKTKL